MKDIKTILVIGSSGLIGSSLINFLVKKNFFVICADLKKSNIDYKKHNNLSFIKTDITKEKSIEKLILILKKSNSKIEAVINCSYPRSSNWGKSFIDSKEKDLKENIANQLSSSIYICRNFYKYFLKQGYGNIILLSSIQGIRSPKFNHYLDTNLKSPIEYSAIKSGIISITKYMAKYSKNKNIRYNCISPGGILNNQPKIFLKKYQKDCINKGMLNPEDLHSAFEYLLSDNSKFVNGQNIVVDDGWSL